MICLFCFGSIVFSGRQSVRFIYRKTRRLFCRQQVSWCCHYQVTWVAVAIRSVLARMEESGSLRVLT